MPMPTASDVHVDDVLTNASIGYKNENYIADMIFPLLPVQKQSDIIAQFVKSHWFRNYAKLRAPGTKSEGSGYAVDNTLKYFADRYSFRFEIPDQVRKNADAPYDMDRDGAAFATDKIQMVREVNWAADFFALTKWTTDLTGVTNFTQWSDYGASDPLVDIEDQKDVVEGLIAREPNDLIMGSQVWRKLKLHPSLLDAIKYTQTANITLQIAAALFEVKRILIGRGIYTTTAEGTAEASVTYTRIWGKHALLLWNNPTPGLMQPAAGYTFVWQEVPAAIQWIKRMRNEEREVDILEANSNFDQKLLAADAGAFFSAAVA